MRQTVEIMNSYEIHQTERAKVMNSRDIIVKPHITGLCYLSSRNQAKNKIAPSLF